MDIRDIDNCREGTLIYLHKKSNVFRSGYYLVVSRILYYEDECEIYLDRSMLDEEGHHIIRNPHWFRDYCIIVCP
jgi:isocitrate/isopropylmalate dehydrogenase